MYDIDKILNIEPKDINEIIDNWFKYKNNLIWEVTYYYDRSVEDALTELYMLRKCLVQNKDKIQKPEDENYKDFNIFNEINTAIEYLKQYGKTNEIQRTTAKIQK